jgi:hypothetical protein
MNEYRCVVLPLIRMVPSNQGFKEPLCTTCRTKNCGNPIEKKHVSLLGVNKLCRVFVQGNNVGGVVQCEGYLSK